MEDSQPSSFATTNFSTDYGNRKSGLENLIAQATASYAVKDYIAAAELYSRATELQAEINGEMSPENADLLYSYGRCLYHVAIGNSNVLGVRAAGENQGDDAKKVSDKEAKGETFANIQITSEQRGKKASATFKEGKDSSHGDAVPNPEAKSHFEFTGDENFDNSEEEELGDRPSNVDLDSDADEDDDFSNAFEVLDLARVLLQRRLDHLEMVESKGKGRQVFESVRLLKEKLADTHDLQAEISLEGERFPSAVVDLKAALKLKQAIFEPDSSLIAEAHFKLSLALEFSSVTQQKDESSEAGEIQHGHVDEVMRAEAAREMEAAITSCKMRIEREETLLPLGLSSKGDVKDTKLSRGSIDDVKEMVNEMEQRLVELREPPISLNDAKGIDEGNGSSSLSGIFSAILGETIEVQRARLEEATKSANDLTSLVKRKKPTKTDTEIVPERYPGGGTSKRKVGFTDLGGESSDGKRSKLEDVDGK